MMVRSPRFCRVKANNTAPLRQQWSWRCKHNKKLIYLPASWCCRQSFDSDVDDANVIIRLVGLGVHLDVADVLRHLHALHHPAKHCVFVVQPWLKHTQQSCTTLMAVTPDRTVCLSSHSWNMHNNHVPLAWLSHLTEHGVLVVQPRLKHTQQSCTTLMAVTPDRTQCACCPAIAGTCTTIMYHSHGCHTWPNTVCLLSSDSRNIHNNYHSHKPCPTFREEKG